MTPRQFLATLAVLPLLLHHSCSTEPSRSETQLETHGLPEPAREFRAAWVATVANIDWPTKPGLPVAAQQQEARAILDRLVALGMNAVVFQVRPQADALYESELEPWSYYLTGRQGQAPEPFYDPLRFWCDEAHARGLQLHAWFNPYRAHHPAGKGPHADNSIVSSRPELCVTLGDDGYRWMDPSLPEVRAHSTAVVLDVVRRYDVDGVHFDDYFYPYPSYNDDADFPDQASYDAYVAGGGEMSRSDWRRAGVDTFLEELYAQIKAERPGCEFGISPFGIWRPGHPEGIQGLDQHEVLFADAKRWWNEGFVDYMTPQLYWPIAQIPQSFPVLLGWWDDENLNHRHLWPGTSIGRAKGDAGVTEILNQVQVVRGMLRGDPGLCLFSMKVLMPADSALADALAKGPWASPALIPASPWLDPEPPAPPRATAAGESADDRRFELDEAPADRFLVLVQEQRGDRWTTTAILPRTERIYRASGQAGRLAFRAVDASRNLSAPTFIELR
jgi:uncharacterized lipoprotein YddW (UPF0748 family)